jgi:hypothetical protein
MVLSLIKCGKDGVFANGIACVARCTNVEVRQCKMSGMIAFSGAITLMGTVVHLDCTSEMLIPKFNWSIH